MKLCIDCKHFRSPDNNSLCGRSEKFVADLVLGEEYPIGRMYCSKQRDSEGYDYCGPEGKFWEPKE